MKKEPFDTPNILESIYEDLASHRITEHEAAVQLHEANMIPYVDEGAAINKLMNYCYVSFEVYRCPDDPRGEGSYVGKTSVYWQALSACENGNKSGKTYFIKGVLPSGEKVVIL